MSSKTIDQRVVEMRFDNRQFEQGVSTSMSTLDKLKKALNFNGATKGLDNVSAAAKGVNFTPLTNAVETVQRGFSALEVIGVTALANITNSAVNTGKQLVKSLTIDQVTAGWDKLSQKTTSVATLVAQGYDMSTVEEQLGRLNWYTDETSYNFTDMVENISKFTATGKGLEESVTAMEGIANWAALSGQNANTASRAMYQLSQAMGAGVMRLEDYKSIQNVSMDTDEFRQKALDAAVALGTLKKNADGTYESLINNEGAFTKSQFAQHLTQDAWFTSDVMMKVFNDYSYAVGQIYEYAEEQGITASQAIEELGGSVDEFGLKAFLAAQEAKTFGDAIDATKDAVSTGWMNTFELIFGNYEEQRVLWTDLANIMYDVFASGAETRNEILAQWKELGGRDDLIEAFHNIFDGVSSIFASIKEGFEDIFPPGTIEEQASRLKHLTESIAEMAETFKKFVSPTSTVSDGLRKITETGVNEYIQSFTGMTSESIDELITLGKTAGYDSEEFKDLASGLAEGYSNVEDRITRLAKAASQTDNVYEMMSEFTGMTEESFEELHKLGETAGYDSEAFHELARGLAEGDSAMEKLITTVMKSIEANQPLENLKNTFKGIFAILDIGRQTLTAVIKGLTPLGDALLGLGKNVLSFTGSLGEWLASLDESLKTGDGLVKVTEGIATAISKVIGFISNLIGGMSSAGEASVKLKEGLSDAGKALDDLGAKSKVLDFIATIGEVFGSMAMRLASLVGKGFENLKEFFNSIDFKRIGELADTFSFGALSIGIVKFISYLKKPMEELGSIKESVIGVIDAVGSRFSAMEKSVNAKSLLTIAGAIGILAASLLVLASIDEKKLGTALGSITSLFIELLASFAVFGKIGAVKGSGALVMFAATILIMTSALKKLSNLTNDQMVTGMSGMIGALVILFAALEKLPTNSISAGGGLLLLAAGLQGIAVALKILGGIPFENMMGALIGVAGALITLCYGFEKMPPNLAKVGAGILIAAVALNILALALRSFGSMSGETMFGGMIALGGALFILAAGLKIMEGTTGGAAALVIASAALAIMAPALRLIGSMPIASIGKAFLVLAGSFLILGVAGAVLYPLTPAITALAGALALVGLAALGIGVGLLAAGAGLSALAVGLTTLAGIGVGAAASIASSITIIGMAAISLIPMIIEKIGEGIVAFCVAIGNGAVAIGEAFQKIIVVIADVVLTTLVEYTPQIVDLLFDFLIEVLNRLADRMPEFVSAVMKVVGALFQSIGDAIRALDSETMLQDLGIIALITGLIVGLSLIGPMIPKAMVALIGVAAFIAELSLLLAAMGAINQIPGLNWLIGEGGKLLQTVGTAIGGFVGGIVGGFMSGVSSQFPRIGKDLAGFMTNVKPFIEGAKTIDSSVLKGVTQLSAAILVLTGAELLSGITSWFSGKSSLTSFARELIPFGQAMKDYSMIVAGMDSSVVSASANAAEALVTLSNNLPKQGGVVGWFTRKNDMASFGENLVTFGKRFSEYALEIQNVDTDVVSATSSATRAIVEISNAIPETGLFSGNTSIADFGRQLSTFGYYFNDYYNYISGINTGALSAVATEMNNLVAMAKGMADVDTSRIVGFGTTLKTLGSVGLDNFTKAFTGATDKIQDAAYTLTDKFLTAATSKQTSFTSTFSKLADSCVKALRQYYSNFYHAGAYLVQGFANGISANTYLAEARARAMAAAAAAAARKELQVDSPSKVGYEIGDFFGLGFVNAIDAYQKYAYDSAANMGDSAKSGLTAAATKIQNALDGDLDMQPVIRPVLDLSSIQAGSRYLNGLIPQGGIQTIRGAELSSRISTSFGSDGSVNPKIQNGVSTPASNTTNTFNIYGTNAQEIAQEVSKILNQQVQRRERAWA